MLNPAISPTHLPPPSYLPACADTLLPEPASAFIRAQQHVDLAAWRLGLDDGLRHILRTPQRELAVQLPVRHDRGELVSYTGYRVQHSLARGPVLGGLRYCPDLTLADVRAAAMRTTWQCAAANLPFGGAAGGVLLDPAQLSQSELERVTRRYTTAAGVILGYDRDILAPDIGTNASVMAWAVDTLSMHHGYTVPAAATGKPTALGGSPSRASLARSCATVLHDICAAHQLSLNSAQVVLAGEGLNTGFAELLADYGARVQTVPNADWLDQPCDVLLLGTGLPQLGAAHAAAIQAQVVVEAGGAIDVAGDAVLEAQGTLVVPDILTGVGPVTEQYFEWVQGQQQFFWSQREIHTQLERMISSAAQQVLAIATKRQLSLRAATLVLAVGRVADAIMVRGIYP